MPSRGSVLVLALGGNAFLRRGDTGRVEEQWRNAAIAAKTIVDAYIRGYSVVVTHGNGPQVGVLLEWMEGLRHRIPPQTLDIAVAMTQGWLGYLLQQAIVNELSRRGVGGSAVTIVTRTLVDPRDPGFEKPSKPIGPFYSEEQARELMRRKGWVMRPDPRGGWRRVVPSPEPKRILESHIVKKLLDDGFIVIAVGGGGIPVVEREKGVYEGVEAVVDKDLASALLAIELGAENFTILTDVEGVYINFRRPGERLLEKLTVEKAEELMRKGEFPAGSMGPKVAAAIRFARATGRAAHIGLLEHGLDVVEGRRGTTIVP